MFIASCLLTIAATGILLVAIELFRRTTALRPQLVELEERVATKLAQTEKAEKALSEKMWEASQIRKDLTHTAANLSKFSGKVKSEQQSQMRDLILSRETFFKEIKLLLQSATKGARK